MKTDMNMFILSIEQFFSYIRGPRYLPLKKGVLFCGSPVSSPIFLDHQNLVCRIFKNLGILLNVLYVKKLRVIQQECEVTSLNYFEVFLTISK